MRRQPRIGMIGVMFEEYHASFPELEKTRTEFARDLVGALLPMADVDFKEVADTSEKVEDQISFFEQNKYDGLLVVFLTYAPSLIMSPALIGSKLPLVIWNTQEASGIPTCSQDMIIIDNHGVHGVQDLANVLGRARRDFLVITGHHEDRKTLDELKNCFYAMKAVTCVKRARIGLLGYSMQDMGDFNIDETALLTQVGPSVRHIEVEVLADYIDAVPEKALMQAIAEDRKRFEWDPSITDEECAAAIRMELAVRKLIAEHRLDGWAQHFMSLGANKRINMLPFLAASKLMEEGIAYGAEGDVTVAASFLIVREITGEAGFAEMFCMDFDDSSILMRHMGEGNMGFAEAASPIRIVRNVFNMVDVLGIPSPVFSARQGDATLVSLAPGGNGRFRLVVAQGEVTDFPGRDSAVSLEYKWRPIIPLNEFLNEYAYAGGSHHQALGYGHFADVVKVVGRFMGIEVIQIC